jgi:death-on-curing protein
MAAAYAYHIAENQPFVDGNKRAALLAALNFLVQNGVSSDRPIAEFYDAMIAIAEKRLDKAGLAAVFREQLKA